MTLLLVIWYIELFTFDSILINGWCRPEGYFRILFVLLLLFEKKLWGKLSNSDKKLKSSKINVINYAMSQ